MTSAVFFILPFSKSKTTRVEKNVDTRIMYDVFSQVNKRTNDNRRKKLN